MPKYVALSVASSGNIFAIVVNYYLGYWLYDKTKTKLNSSRIGNKSLHYGDKYGYIVLVFSWLPLIGDPLTLVAGMLRLNFFIFVFVAGFMRILRYYLLAYMV